VIGEVTSPCYHICEARKTIRPTNQNIIWVSPDAVCTGARPKQDESSTSLM
jgi:hypothetical protein